MIRKIAIVSLSLGKIGSPKVKHEIEIGLKRLKDYGIETVMMPHAMDDMQTLIDHPEYRASDLLMAMADDSIEMILCAIGGDDTYRLLPYLFDHDELKNVAKQKIFLGFSDTTMNHLMLHKLGIKTYYGQCFFADTCELDKEMLSYSKKYFEELLNTGTISELTPSDTWFEDRTDWSVGAVGTPRVAHKNKGWELLQGNGKFEGEILGGCIESMFDCFDNTRYEDTIILTQKYGLFPSLDDWKEKILLLETSEELDDPEHYRVMLKKFKEAGVLDVISGIICGQPLNDRFHDELNNIIIEVANNPNLPILANVNVGHSCPRAILPFGVHAKVDAEKQIIKFDN